MDVQLYTGTMVPFADMNMTTVLSMETDDSDDALYLQIRLVVYLVIAAVGIGGNSLVVWVMCMSKPLRAKLTNQFIIHQSILDLIGSLFLLAHSANRYNAGGHFGFWGQVYCRFWSTKVFMWSAFLSSTYNLVALTLERYFKICHPIKHKVSFGPVQAKIILTVVWLFGPVYEIALFVPTSPANEEGVCEFMTVFPNDEIKRFCGFLNAILKLFLPVGVMIVAYYKMYRAIKSKVQPQAQKRAETQEEGDDKAAANAPPGGEKRDDKMQKASKNVFKTLVGVSICYAVCWTFNQFYFVWFNLGFPTDWTSPFYHFTVMMAFVNCCTNPFIYGYSYEPFKQEVRKLFCGGKSSSQEGSSIA